MSHNLNAESLKKLRDKRWRMEHLYKIVDKHSTLRLFKFNKEQEILFNSYMERRKQGVKLRDLIDKNRQIGITTFHCLWYLDDAIFRSNRNNGIIAHERGALEKIFTIVKTAWTYMPDWVKPVAERENLRELYFPSTNSSIFITLKARSGTLSGLHVSEYAKIEDIVELKAGSFQAAGEGDITCEFTGNGLNHAYADWVDDQNVFNKVFFSWLIHGEYSTDVRWEKERAHEEYLNKIGANEGQKNWWYAKLAELRGIQDQNKYGYTELQLMQQEYPATAEESFISSGKGIFTNELEGICEMKVLSSIHNPNCIIEIFEEYDDSQQYCLGADPSGGFMDGDKSCFYICNSRTRKVAVRWHGVAQPDQFGTEIFSWAVKYEAYCGIEVNNHGLSTINAIKDEPIELYRRERRDKVTNEVTKELGWSTNVKSKDELIDNGRVLLREKVVDELPKHLISELKTFVKKPDGSVGAEAGCHDDEVMAWLICQMMIQVRPYYETRKRERTYMGNKLR